MYIDHSFRFLNSKLNQRFQRLLSKSGIEHVVDQECVAHYLPDDVETVENELLRSVRDSVFPSWQIISCPEDWANRYKIYMRQHDIPFEEELIDYQLCFLIPRKYRPHTWKLDNEDVGVNRIAH